MRNRNQLVQSIANALENGWDIDHLSRCASGQYYLVLKPVKIISEFLTESEIRKLGLDPVLDLTEKDD
jgi:hypothetical protein